MPAHLIVAREVGSLDFSALVFFEGAIVNVSAMCSILDLGDELNLRLAHGGVSFVLIDLSPSAYTVGPRRGALILAYVQCVCVC